MRAIAFVSALLVAATAAAQDVSRLFKKASPDVEEALRSRITAFYQLHVDGKFRQAERFVAEDTKDFFYSANKPKYLSFAIDRIEYSDGFTRAKATVLCEQYVLIPGFADKPLKVPTPSHWKVEKGEWFWFVDQDKLLQTPFGRANPGTAPASGGAGLTMPTAEEILRKVQGGVQADRTDVALEQTVSAPVRFNNTLPGQVTLTVDPIQMPHLQAAFRGTRALSAAVEGGESTTLFFFWKPDQLVDPGPRKVRVTVEPTKQVIDLNLTFVAPKATLAR